MRPEEVMGDVNITMVMFENLTGGLSIWKKYALKLEDFNGYTFQRMESDQMAKFVGQGINDSR